MRAELFIRGEWRNDAPFQAVVDTDTGEVIGECAETQTTHLELALDSASTALRELRVLQPEKRADVLSRAAAQIRSNSDLFASTISLEGIKTIREARREVHRCVMTLESCASAALSQPTNEIDVNRGRGVWVRQPTGAVLAVTPFNDPLNLVAHKLGPAVAIGAPVLLKPHRSTPLSAMLLVRALLDAGMHPNQVQFIPGDGKTIVPRVLQSDVVRVVSFTGSRENAQQVTQHAGFRQLVIEAGGICPTIVLDDTDLPDAAAKVVSGAFWAAGQNCLHAQRILIHKRVFPEFRDLVVDHTRKLRQGSKQSTNTDVGPMRSEHAATKALEVVKSAIDQGARVLIGGSRSNTRVSPTWIDNTEPHMAVIKLEIFGPISTLEPINNLDDAIQRLVATQTLQAGIFTSAEDNIREAFESLNVGALIVNETSDYRDDSMPFGGPGSSGVGREGTSFAIEAYTEPKLLVTMNKTTA
jgi:glyceraldehyde-3-phosphate dehydrogenase (NADP+)